MLADQVGRYALPLQRGLDLLSREGGWWQHSSQQGGGGRRVGDTVRC